MYSGAFTHYARYRSPLLDVLRTDRRDQYLGQTRPVPSRFKLADHVPDVCRTVMQMEGDTEYLRYLKETSVYHGCN
jgi:hypothetical protein